MIRCHTKVLQFRFVKRHSCKVLPTEENFVITCLSSTAGPRWKNRGKHRYRASPVWFSLLCTPPFKLGHTLHLTFHYIYPILSRSLCTVLAHQKTASDEKKGGASRNIATDFSSFKSSPESKRMGNVGVQIVCVGLGVLGLIGVIVCCAIPRWTVSSFVGSNIVTAQSTYKGLWMECVVQSTGQQQCKNYDSLLVLSSDLQAARAMTIISGMLSALSLLILFCGADFTTCVENEDAKPKISLVSGVGMLIAGLLVIIAASWSAHKVVRDFNNPLVHNSQKMELGACIFVGWGAGVLLLLAGGLLCCFSRPRSSSGGTAKYYSNSASAPSKNYV